MFGWVSVAAAAGWVAGALVYLIFYHQLHYMDALFSEEAWNGIALGFVVGFSGTLVLVRDWTWAIVWALRAGMLGLAVGTATVLRREAAGEGGVLGLLWIALTSKPAGWGALILALLVGGVWIVRGPEVTWILRGGFWRFLAWFKFAGNRPVAIPPPRRRWWWKRVAWLKFLAEHRAAIAHETGSVLEGLWQCLKSRLDHRLRQSKPRWPLLDNIPVVPFNERYPIPITDIKVSGAIPADEAAPLKQLFSEFQVRLLSVFPPMQAARPLPPISSDHVQAFEQAYGILQRRAFDPPDLPPEYEGSPDLGSLAVRGPYSGYLRFVPGTKQDPRFEWDFRGLHEFEVQEGLYRLGIRVLFRVEPVERVENGISKKIKHLVPYRIDHLADDQRIRIYKPLDPAWQFAKHLALCAATTHLSLVRHFNWVHLASGDPLARCTRNHLPSDHPIRRLLWPHIYGTQQSNYMVTLVQMIKDGDFESIFSFTHEGMCQLFEKAYRDFNFVVNDPKQDAGRRRVREYLLKAGIENSQRNLEDLFNVIHAHVRRYLNLYYPGPDIQDSWIRRWVDNLNDHQNGIPNGVGTSNPLTKDFVARLIARCIYLTTVQHEMVGTFLWNYQLWTHRQPIRVYKNGRREPLDVYQRLVNANFNLNVTRRALMDDFSYLALDDQGADAFLQFKKELDDLQKKMKQQPWEVWKVYPQMLEANINA